MKLSETLEGGGFNNVYGKLFRCLYLTMSMLGCIDEIAGNTRRRGLIMFMENCFDVYI